MRTRLVMLVLLLVGVVGLAAPPASGSSSASAGRFIVTLTDGADSRRVAGEYRDAGARVDFVYRTALNGFAGEMSEVNLGQLRRDRRVARIERDGTARATVEQTNATWGLDRVDARTGLDGSYSYEAAGAGVTAYVLDTGLRATHAELVGRTATGADFVGDGRGTDDCNGHGTHVAGTIGGTLYGVAKAVKVAPVRVLNCRGSGSWSGVIAGIEWVTANAARPAVANMSLGGGASSSVDNAVRNSISSGITYVVAAGNEGADACGYSPARVAEALTIGATTSTDGMASYSNWGACVDLFAPGSSITSAWYKSDTATNTISGTSMASPHVAGAAALQLTVSPAATPGGVAQSILDASTRGIVTSSNTPANHLLYAPVTAGRGTVTGTVTTGDPETPVAGATVAAGAETTQTGDDGAYTLLLPPGDHAVEVSKPGFVTQSATVTVTAGVSTPKSFVLEASTADAPVPATISLTLSSKKLKGSTSVTARWVDSEGHAGRTYTVKANTSTWTVSNTDTHTQTWKGGGTLSYTVCRQGTTTCGSATITI